jgi:hypothetical protein
MSNVIRFLESMGANAAMARMSISEYRAAVLALNIDEDQQDCLIRGDNVDLSGHLNARTKMICMVVAPDDESQQEEKRSDEDGHESPDDEDASRE